MEEDEEELWGRCGTLEVNIGGDTVCLQGEYKIDTEREVVMRLG